MRPWRTLKSERGFALAVALGILVVLSVSVVAVISLSSSGARSANRSEASESAYHLAEAGLAEAFSILDGAAVPIPPTTTLPLTERSLEGGKVKFSGSYVQPIWTITSIGSVPSPSGGADVNRTLTQKATVQPLVPGATAPEWDRLFHANTTTCLTIDTVTVPASVTSAGDLCLVGTGKVTGSRSRVEVGDDVTISGSGSTSSLTRSAGAAAGWTNPGDIVSSNNVRASNVIAGSSSGASLDATGFGFAVPAGATITGIVARVERMASNSSSISDLDVYLLKNGTPVGANRAVSSTWGTSDSTRTYGSSSDLWGTTWTASDVNAGNFGLRFAAQNANSSSRTASVDHIELQVYYQPAPSGSIGLPGPPVAAVSRAEIAGTCTLASGPANTPCSSVDNVFATTYTTTPPNLTKPQVDMQYWYDNAKPGPKHGCDPPGSFPGGFDNNAQMDGSLPDYGNDNEDIDQLTPSFISYSCKVVENGDVVGEVSWNHNTHVLTLDGTIFIDGNVRFDKDGTLVNYNGRAILYSGGDLEFDEVVCAGGDGTNNCWAGDMSDWDPEQNMLIILSAGWSEYDQGDNLEPAAFQGVMYAQDECLIHQDFRSSGPILCDEIRIEYTGDWPTFYEWPELQSLIAGQMYGSFASAADYKLILGDVVG